MTGEVSPRPDPGAAADLPAGGEVSARTLRIPAADGFPLAATLFHPEKGADRPVILAPAMGTKRGYYAQYAADLAGRGFTVVSFDYRGIGGSRPASFRGFDASLEEWGTEDLAGVIDWVTAAHPARAPVLVGHSVGAQVLGLAPNNGEVAGVVAVTAGSAYWRLWSGPARYALALLWYVGVPALTAAFSYFPAGLVGLGEDLPGGVARDWARLARRPGYIFGAERRQGGDGFGGYGGSLLAYSFTDDFYSPRAAVEKLLEAYGGADREHRHLAPGDVGLAEVGHFGFFRESARETLWRESAEWIRRA